MMENVDLPVWAALLTGSLMVLGSSLALIGSIGLLRLKSFYQRLHGPTLGTTLGTGAMLIGSMIYFSVLQTRPILHEILVAVFVTVTTPVTFILLARAARHRTADDEARTPGEPADR